jgi:5-methylcytosine-specific restriction protein A
MSDRIRGRRLQRIRADYFKLHPLCALCQQRDPPRVRVAVILDHRIALVNGGPDFDTDNGTNRQGLCQDCSDEKTAADLNQKPRGCDADGWPTDPRHPWNLKRKA